MTLTMKIEIKEQFDKKARMLLSFNHALYFLGLLFS